MGVKAGGKAAARTATAQGRPLAGGSRSTAAGARAVQRTAPTGPQARSGKRRAGPAPVAPPRPAPGPFEAPTDWRVAVRGTVEGLRYELVDVERAPRGLLRVTIDRLAGQAYAEPGDAVTVGDCEAVTRQLQYALEVDGVDYARLEVSSPGLDRPLRTVADYERFAGQRVQLTLRLPYQGRKHFQGVLGRAGEGWQMVFEEGKAEHVLSFALDEVREARLVPVVDFKGRKAAGASGGAPAVSGPAAREGPAADKTADGGSA
ncbi:MAG: ribosome maturation factor RimP [Rubrivivax sp.]|nr:ribosome maturation factor RimP [Rubrivivax sp.]